MPLENLNVPNREICMNSLLLHRTVLTSVRPSAYPVPPQSVQNRASLDVSNFVDDTSYFLHVPGNSRRVYVIHMLAHADVEAALEPTRKSGQWDLGV